MKYQLLTRQKELLSSNIDTTPLRILQRNSITRLKQTIEKKRVYYHSSNEEDEHIRIIIFAFLNKIFRQYSLDNQKKLQKFKNIIYSSQLNHYLTTSQGIQINQLFKCFAENINTLQIDQRAEESISSLMNSSTFFEDVIFVAIRNKIQRNSTMTAEEQTELLISFFDREFNMTIRILNLMEKSNSQKIDEIILFVKNSHLYKRSIMLNEEMSSSSSYSKELSSIRQLSPLSKSRLQESIKMDTSNKYEDSLPSKNNSTGKKSLGKNISPFDCHQPIKTKKKKEKEKKGFFDVFCCCD